MKVSREQAIEEMKQTIGILQRWIEELETPREIDSFGDEIPTYETRVPPMLSVDEVRNFPVAQFRAELVISAAKLEALAST